VAWGDFVDVVGKNSMLSARSGFVHASGRGEKTERDMSVASAQGVE